MKRSGFTQRNTELKRTAFSAKPKHMKQVSDKKRAYRASDEGKEATAYMSKVKQLPCAVCGADGPSDAHHVIHDRFGSRKSSDFDVIPLCKRHHQDGPAAIHNGKETWRQKYGSDYDYIDQTRKAVSATE